MSRSLNDLASAEFLAWLPTIPWFSALGRPNARDSEVKRIWGWKEWPGPENPGVDEYAAGHTQGWRDRIYRRHTSKRDELKLYSAWGEAVQIGFKAAVQHVPEYDPEGDAYHAPTSCVWSAAWVSAVINIHLVYREPLPPLVHTVWDWYLAGHWPCGLVESNNDAPASILIVL